MIMMVATIIIVTFLVVYVSCIIFLEQLINELTIAAAIALIAVTLIVVLVVVVVVVVVVGIFKSTIYGFWRVKT